MKIKPIYTEKSLDLSKKGVYSFWVLPNFSKNEISNYLKSNFDVVVGNIKTLNYKKLKKKTMRGVVKTIPAMKKVLVTLKSGTLNWYEEEKKKIKPKKK
jgi:ribosomal protein L23